MSDEIELNDTNVSSPAESVDANHQAALLEEIRITQSRARRSLVELKQRGGAGSIDGASYRKAAAELEAFLLEIEPLLLDPQFERSEYYREKVDLGAAEIGDERYGWTGLLSLVPVEGVEVEEEVETPGLGNNTTTETVLKPVPVAILLNALREASLFLQANGLGLRLEANEIDETSDPF